MTLLFQFNSTKQIQLMLSPTRLNLIQSKAIVLPFSVLKGMPYIVFIFLSVTLACENYKW